MKNDKDPICSSLIWFAIFIQRNIFLFLGIHMNFSQCGSHKAGTA